MILFCLQIYHGLLYGISRSTERAIACRKRLTGACRLYGYFSIKLIAATSSIFLLTACVQGVTEPPSLPPTSSPPSFPAASAIAAPSSTLTADFAPFGTIEFPLGSPVVAGAPQILEVRLRALEPTQWNVPAFTSTYDVTGLPAGFTADAESAHTIQTTVSIPATAAGKMCTIQSEVTAIGTRFPRTIINLRLDFQVVAQ